MLLSEGEEKCGAPLREGSHSWEDKSLRRRFHERLRRIKLGVSSLLEHELVEGAPIWWGAQLAWEVCICWGRTWSVEICLWWGLDLGEVLHLGERVHGSIHQAKEHSRAQTSSSRHKEERAHKSKRGAIIQKLQSNLKRIVIVSSSIVIFSLCGSLLWDLYIYIYLQTSFPRRGFIHGHVGQKPMSSFVMCA